MGFSLDTRSPAVEVIVFFPSSLWPSFLSSSLVFMGGQSGSQVEFPSANFTKPLHEFTGIGPGELLCLVGQL